MVASRTMLALGLSACSPPGDRDAAGGAPTVASLGDGGVDAATSPPDAQSWPEVDALAPADLDASVTDGGDASSSLDAGGSAPKSSPGCAAATTAVPGKTALTLELDGQPRSVNLYTPSSYDGQTALPLVLDFHGLHLGAAAHELISEWDDAVEANGFIVAMPQGVDNAWNLGPCCTASRTLDDVQFARDIVKHVAEVACIDLNRVYATGYSNGGGMSYKLACDAADVFAAVAPAAFDLLEEMDCSPTRPLSVFMFRGTSDPIVPYQGGPSTPPTVGYSLPEIHFLGAQATFERWAELDGCGGAPVDIGNGCQTYTQCKAGVKVTLCTNQGGGHEPSDPSAAWPMLEAYTLAP